MGWCGPNVLMDVLDQISRTFCHGPNMSMNVLGTFWTGPSIRQGKVLLGTDY